jgi:cytochrome c biogenesis protein CcmG, thiol:disulfide interchange protein DsbE
VTTVDGGAATPTPHGADDGLDVDDAPGTPGTADTLDGELDEPPRRRTGLIVSAVVAVLAIGFVWVLGTSESGTDREADSPLLGKVAPALAGPTLDGEQFVIDDHRGEWVVVNLFATWCGPCRQEHPELVAFDEAHNQAGDVELVSVLFDDRPNSAREYFDQNGGEWPVVIDEDGRIATDYGVSGVPETYVIAPDGRVVAKLIGGVTSAGLDQVIAEAGGSSSSPRSSSSSGSGSSGSGSGSAGSGSGSGSGEGS